MAESSQLAGGLGPEVDFRGRRIQLTAWGIEDFAAARNHLRAVLPDPFDGLNAKIKDLHPDVQKAIGLSAYEDSKKRGQLNTPEAREYFTSEEGIAFFVWRSMLTNASDLEYADVLSWIREVKRERALKLMEELQTASGLDEKDVEAHEGNSRKSTKGTQRRKTSKSTGNTSTGSSRRSTLGQALAKSAGLRTHN